MKDKNKWLLIKQGRQERALSRGGRCLPYQQIERSSPQGPGLFLSPLKRLFLLLLLFLVLHMASQVYSPSLTGAIVTLSSLGSVS